MTTVTTDPKAGKRERLDAATYRVWQAADRALVSDRTMWRMIDAGKVPGVIRIGRSVRISRARFDAWLDNGGAK